MIVELLLTPIFNLIVFLLKYLPELGTLPNWSLQAVSLLSKGLFFFPTDVWFVVIANVFFWHLCHISWSIIEWVYKKIPGIN